MLTRLLISLRSLSISTRYLLTCHGDGAAVTKGALATGEKAQVEIGVEVFGVEEGEILHSPPILPFPSFSLSDMFYDPTNLIWRKGTPLEAMIGHMVPSSDGLLGKVFWSIPQL